MKRQSQQILIIILVHQDIKFNIKIWAIFHLPGTKISPFFHFDKGRSKQINIFFHWDTF